LVEAVCRPCRGAAEADDDAVIDEDAVACVTLLITTAPGVAMEAIGLPGALRLRRAHERAFEQSRLKPHRRQRQPSLPQAATTMAADPKTVAKAVKARRKSGRCWSTRQLSPPSLRARFEAPASRDQRAPKWRASRL